MSWRQKAKIKAAEKVVEHIKDDMIIGIGSGSTAAEGIRILGDKIRNGEIRGVRAVPTSYQAIQEAVKAQIPLTTLDEHPVLDFGFDGVLEVAVPGFAVGLVGEQGHKLGVAVDAANIIRATGGEESG